MDADHITGTRQIGDRAFIATVHPLRAPVAQRALGSASDRDGDDMDNRSLAVDAIEAYAGRLRKKQLREHGTLASPSKNRLQLPVNSRLTSSKAILLANPAYGPVL